MAGVTLEEVRDAIASLGATPDQTNAGAIRNQIGRGSLSTIQRHLAALRTPPAPAPVAVPPPPKETLELVWSAAVSAAGAGMAVRIERLTVERDQLASALAIAESDIETALASAEQAEEDRAEIDEMHKAAVAEFADCQARVGELEGLLEASKKAIEVERSELLRASEQQQAKQRHDQELQTAELRSALDRAGEREGRLHAENARLHEQVGRLQAELESCRAQRANGNAQG